MQKNDKNQLGALCYEDGVFFRVWAPFAKAVSVSGSFNDWSRTVLQNENNGYWSGDVAGAKAGQEYKYVIDTGGGEIYKNDPRALQLTSSAGNSVIVNPSFNWNQDQFERAASNQIVSYEMHIGTFNRPDPSVSGTFATAAEKLDYLADLGINMIEIMPVASMAVEQKWWGYTPDFIYAVESTYGGRGQFMEFIKSAHERGIAVVLDVVYNHIGPSNNDLWQFDGWSQDGKGGIYFYNDWRSKTPWGDTRPDYGRPEVRRYILDNIRMWLVDFHLDGLRVDSTIYIRNAHGFNDDPGSDIAEGWSLLREMTDLTHQLKPSAITIAEDVGANSYLTRSPADGGAGFAGQWEVNFPRILRNALDSVNDSDRNIGAIADALLKNYNGDVFQRVVYSDSHDSAANGGARLSEEISPGNPTSVFAQRRNLLASAIVLSCPAIPMLFQGQEFMQGGSFNDWQALDWQNTDKFAGIVLAHKHLISLRKNTAGVSKGLSGQSVKIIHYDENNKVLAYHRWDQGGPGDDVVVIVNFSNNQLNVYQLGFPRSGIWNVRFNSDWKGYSPEFSDEIIDEILVENNVGVTSLAPYSALILSQDSSN